MVTKRFIPERFILVRLGGPGTVHPRKANGVGMEPLGVGERPWRPYRASASARRPAPRAPSQGARGLGFRYESEYESPSLVKVTV